jgi:hypothetical protein
VTRYFQIDDGYNLPATYPTRAEAMTYAQAHVSEWHPSVLVLEYTVREVAHLKYEPAEETP